MKRFFEFGVKPQFGRPGPRGTGGDLPPRLYGIIAEFPSPERLLEAVKRSRAAGYQVMEAYTPYPVEGLVEAIGHGPSRVPLLVLIGGILGGAGGYALQYWASVIEYPLNIGGRPFHSWPAFIPATFEMTILVAGIFAVLGMLILNGLPMPYHPVFNVPRFELASRDRYFLMLLRRDPLFHAEKTLDFMNTLEATEVTRVED
jgi:Protein of unknown function (DUF3341)